MDKEIPILRKCDICRKEVFGTVEDFSDHREICLDENVEADSS